MTTPDFDLPTAHRYFSADCFNRAWDVLDQTERTPDDKLLLESLAHASIYHWRQRADCSPKNLSIGYWQLSRVYAVLNDSANALRFAEHCLAQSGELEPFYLAFAHEALARAYQVGNDAGHAAKHRALAASIAEQIADAGNREALMGDLATIG